MKGKKFYLILIGLIAIGISSVLIYRQQQEARALEFKDYEISAIKNRVEDLYTDEKTDIRNDISTELVNLESVFSELEEKDLSNYSKNQIEEMKTEFSIALEMHDLQEKISELFEMDEIIHKDTTIGEIKKLQSLLVNFEDKIVYYNRNTDSLNEARVQIETIEEAEKLAEKITSEEISNTNFEEKHQEAEKLISQIKNEEIKESLMRNIKDIRLALNEADITEDEEAAIDEDIDELDGKEYTEEPESDTIEYIEETVVEESSTRGSTRSSQDRSSKTERTIETPNPVNNKPSNNQAKPPVNNGTSSSESKAQSNTSQQESSSNRNTIAEKYQETKKEDIMYSTTRMESSSLTKGTEIVLSTGTVGSKTITYEVTLYTNGTSNRKIISEDIVEPVDEIVTVGTREPASDEKTTDED